MGKSSENQTDGTMGRHLGSWTIKTKARSSTWRDIFNVLVKKLRKFQSNLVGNLQFLKIPKIFFVPHSNGRCMIPSNSIYHWPHPKIGCLNPEFPSVAEKSALANPRFFGSEIWKPWVFHRVFHVLFFWYMFKQPHH